MYFDSDIFGLDVLSLAPRQFLEGEQLSLFRIPSYYLGIENEGLCLVRLHALFSIVSNQLGQSKALLTRFGDGNHKIGVFLAHVF